jgi:HAD superfamily hydrolase (TIGR01509 family)
MAEVRALVFDFDGLIIDTEGPVYQAWREVYEEHGEELSFSFWQSIIGRGSNWFDPLADLEKRLGRALDGEAIRIARRVRVEELVAALPILPGVEEWIEAARRRGLKLAVASSSSRSWVVGHLERLGLGARWDAIRCRDDVARAKPDPDLYLAAVKDLGVRPAEAVAVEDSPHGCLAAKRAGLYCVAVPSALTSDLDFSAADLRLGSLAELSLDELLAREDVRGRKLRKT